MSAIDELEAVVFQWRDQCNTKINPVIFQMANNTCHRYRLQFVDEDDPQVSRGWRSQKFEDCMQWAELTLSSWPDCSQTKFDTWDFKYRNDAEKFATVFHLSWQQ